KAGGAGLGLYLVANSSSEFHVNLYPGVATEAICIFDLTAAKIQLKSFGMYKEKIDVAGRLAVAGAQRRVVTGATASGGGARAPAGLRAGLVASILPLVGSLGGGGWQPRLRPGKGSRAAAPAPPPEG